MTLQPWIIEPRDSLIVRDGKHFGDDASYHESLRDDQSNVVFIAIARVVPWLSDVVQS